MTEFTPEELGILLEIAWNALSNDTSYMARMLDLGEEYLWELREKLGGYLNPLSCEDGQTVTLGCANCGKCPEE